MKTITTKAQYNKVRKMLDANNAALEAYRTANKTNGIPSEIWKAFPFAKQVTNELRSAIEVYEFINEIPTKYFLYINEKNRTATTWTGDVLGNVYFGSEFRSNMGDKRQPITVKAINGKTYAGTYFKSAGDYARVKICK